MHQPWERGWSAVKLKHKLVGGYAIALGIASIGTLHGVWLGNRHHHKALAIHQQASSEQQILHQLQVGILYNRPGKQLRPYFDSPDAFEAQSDALIQRLTDLKRLLANYNQQSHSRTLLPELPPLLLKYEGTVDQVLNKTQEFVSTATPMVGEPSELQALRQNFRALVHSPEFIEFIEFPDDLFPLSQIANAYEEEARIALQQAEELRTQVILSGLMVSIVISSLLSWYISRTIAQPLAAVTQTAQKVTRDEDFDLRVMVNTDDEVGTLAIALNQLILRVGTLLEQQRQSASMQELLQNEKMAMLGRMVSEIAHEINNPINYIGGNLKHAQRYVDDLFDLLHTYDKTLTVVPDAVCQKADDIDRAFIESDLPKLIQSMQIGANRTQQIALSLRNFSRLDDTTPSLVDLHTCLDDTLLILSNQLKQGIDVQLSYGEIPLVLGYAGPLYQVLTNLISNAIDALIDTDTDHPTIKVKTHCPSSLWVEINITDNGPGIATEHLSHIFDALFTTKPMGMGTGLGLAISQQIIEEKHQGKLTCQSSLGQGATFCIQLPIIENPGLKCETRHVQHHIGSKQRGGTNCVQV
ncbi:MAG: HAMP domain-containing histidine kinase [Merismopedia sp. SIO2A8]|nr:HAMP domain-containing histidine kinase [Merismopedia sp. SIO2A8]